jgi:F0F1-type ATP synthase epsilon subunit
VETTSTTSSDFTRYHTYSFDLAQRAPGDFGASGRSIDAQQRAMSIVADVMAHKGYVNVPDHADLVVTIAAGEAEVVEIHTNQEAFVVPAGALVIDAYDPVSKQRVWQSVAGGEVHSDGIDEERLVQLVHKMMKHFPTHHAQ